LGEATFLSSTSFCYVDDLTSGVVRLAQSDEHILVNIGNRTEFSNLECAQPVLEVTGSKSAPRFEPLSKDDPAGRRPEITEARTTLGWEPRISLKGRLERSLEFFRVKLENCPAEQRA
jgi:dTDP-glucose 4,6-dehydratase